MKMARFNLLSAGVVLDARIDITMVIVVPKIGR
jgi:hypothetical protein